MTFPINLDASAIHIKRAGIAQNKLATLTVSSARRKVKPHIEKVRKNILKQLAIRERDRKKGVKGSQAVYYKLKEIEHVIETQWPSITKSVKKTAGIDVPIGAKTGFRVVNAELGTAYRTPLVAAAFADSVDLVVKTAAKVHTKVIRAEIVQGMIANDDYATSAARVAQFFDKGKGCGHYKNPFANATRVIRSETQLAHVRAKVALYENEGYTRVLIVNGKVGCPICAPHIGEIYRLAEDPLPIYHPHCGCSAVAFDRKPKPPENQIPESKPVPVERETDFQKVPKNKKIPTKSLEVDETGKTRARVVNDFEKKWIKAGAVKNKEVGNLFQRFDSPAEILETRGKTAYFQPGKQAISMDLSNEVASIGNRETFIHEWAHYVDERLGQKLTGSKFTKLSSQRDFRAAIALDKGAIERATKNWYKGTVNSIKPSTQGWRNINNRWGNRTRSLERKLDAIVDKTDVSFDVAIKQLTTDARKQLKKDKSIYGKLFRAKEFDFSDDSKVRYLYNASLDKDKSYLVDILGTQGPAGRVTVQHKLSDLVCSTTKNNLGYGHSKAYNKSGKAGTEVFAEAMVMINEGGIWEKLAKDLAPNIMKEAKKVLKNVF